MEISELELLIKKGFNCDYFVQYKNAYYFYWKTLPDCNCSCSGGAMFNKLKEKLNLLKQQELMAKNKPVQTARTVENDLKKIANVELPLIVQVAQLKNEIYSGHHDQEKIKMVYERITGKNSPVNINVMKRTILNFG